MAQSVIAKNDEKVNAIFCLVATGNARLQSKTQ